MIISAAYKNAIREQKLALEISAAKRESSFYLSKVDQSRALISIEERIKKVILLIYIYMHVCKWTGARCICFNYLTYITD